MWKARSRRRADGWRNLMCAASRRRRLRKSQPSGLELRDRIAEQREAFLEEVAELRHAEQIGGGALAVGGGGFLAYARPVVGGVVVAAEPGERDQIDLLVDRHRVDERDDLLDGRIVAMVLQHRDLAVVGRIRSVVR